MVSFFHYLNINIMNSYFIISSLEGRLRAYPYPDRGRQWYGIAKNDPHAKHLQDGSLVLGILRTIKPLNKPSFEVLEIGFIYTPSYKFVGIETHNGVPCLVYDHTCFDEDIQYSGGRKHCYVESYTFNGMKTVRVYAPLCKGQEQDYASKVLETILNNYQDAKMYKSIMAQSPTAMFDAYKAVADYEKSLEGFNEIKLKSFYISEMNSIVKVNLTLQLIAVNKNVKPTEVSVEFTNSDIVTYFSMVVVKEKLVYQINWDKLFTLPEFYEYDLSSTIKPSGYSELFVADLQNNENKGSFITKHTKFGEILGYDVIVSYPAGKPNATETITIDDTVLTYDSTSSMIRVILSPNTPSSILKEEVMVDITNTDDMRGYISSSYNQLDVLAYENMPKSAPVITGNIDDLISSLISIMYNYGV